MKQYHDLLEDILTNGEIRDDRTITDNDVADACGIGHWAIKNWEKAI